MDNLDWIDKFAPPPPPPPNPNGSSWWFKFAPKETPPTAPQTAPNPIPTENTPEHMQTYEAIQYYNNNLSNFAGTNPDGTSKTIWQDPVKGVIINKITEDQALAISERIKPSVVEYQLPLTFVMACLAIESTMDPNCQNGNLGPGESNTANDPLGYDMGIAQLKLRYLLNIAPGCVDADSCKAFALDIDKAIPYHCSIMAGNVLWAQNVIQEAKSANASMNNPYILGTCAYNYGRTGVMTYYAGGTLPSHGIHVINLEAYFAGKLGVTSVFVGLE